MGHPRLGDRRQGSTLRRMLHGVGVALVTIFTAQLEVDLQATVAHAERMVDHGMRHLLIAGSTGEAAALDDRERADLVSAVRAALPSDIPVIAGTGAPSSRQAMHLTSQAIAAGADAVLALSPRGSHDLRAYYTAVSHAAGRTPVIAYHFPGMSEPGIPLSLLPELPVNGCKDSSGDPNRLLEELTALAIPIYVGNSALLALAGPLGAAGAILQAANVEPDLCALAFTGDIDAQRQLAAAHAATKVRAPNGTKDLMAERWGTPRHARLS